MGMFKTAVKRANSGTDAADNHNIISFGSLFFSLQHHAAADVNHFTIDIARAIGRQKRHTLADVFRLAGVTRGILLIMICQTFSGTPRVMSVSIKPGQMAFTVTPFSPVRGRRFGHSTTPAFDAE